MTRQPVIHKEQSAIPPVMKVPPYSSPVVIRLARSSNEDLALHRNEEKSRMLSQNL